MGRILGILPFVMIGLAVGGLGAMHVYMTSPSAVGEPPASWPLTSIDRRDGAWTLVVAIHPKCPCTVASVAELTEVIRKSPADLDVVGIVRVPFTATDAVAASWTSTLLVESLRDATNDKVRIIEDHTGTLAERFGALTSGHAILFDTDGTRRFEGGVTKARGMRGDNAGIAAVRALLDGREPAVTSTPVFGCPISSTRTLASE
ncbi:MAG: RedB protein [Planctomycetota bacterium]